MRRGVAISNLQLFGGDQPPPFILENFLGLIMRRPTRQKTFILGLVKEACLQVVQKGGCSFSSFDNGVQISTPPPALQGIAEDFAVSP